jgi:hypothetical protein
VRGRSLAAASAGALLLLAGCAAAPAGPPFTVLATDARMLIGDVPRADLVTRGIEVRRVSHVIFWVPTTPQAPTVREAVDAALARGKGDLLVNASVKRVAWYVPLLYGEYGWIVLGDVVRLRGERYDLAGPPREPRSGDFAPEADPGERPGAAPERE